MNFPILKTNRFLLRQFNENDLENVFKGLSNPEITKYYGISYPTLEATKKQLEYFEQVEKNETGIWWAICSLGKEEFYGACGLNNRSKINHKAEIGFWLLNEFWGKGIISETAPVICKFGFEKLALHRIEAWVETENINSKNTLENLGFDHEGTLRECEIKNDKFISLDIFSIIKKD